VKFPCPTKLDKGVIWRGYKPQPLYIYSHGDLYAGIDPRLTVNQNRSYTLGIANVTVDDSGSYECEEDTDFGHRYSYRLTVIGKLQILLCLR